MVQCSKLKWAPLLQRGGKNLPPPLASLTSPESPPSSSSRLWLFREDELVEGHSARSFVSRAEPTQITTLGRSEEGRKEGGGGGGGGDIRGVRLRESKVTRSQYVDSILGTNESSGEIMPILAAAARCIFGFSTGNGRGT